MDVYSISSDFSNYRFLTFSNDSSAEKADNFTGQRLSQQWEPIEVQLFHDPKIKNDNRSLNFDATCYHMGQLWVNEAVANIMKAHFPNAIEVLPIASDLLQPFSYINVLNTVPALKRPVPAYAILMKMARSHELEFDLAVIENEILFRDQIFNSEYYCTEKFIEFINNHDIKGLLFTKEGIAK